MWFGRGGGVPQEVRRIKQACGKDFLTVCPGVRPQWATMGDQKRVMTPKQALAEGADYLVIGRPITHAHNPPSLGEATGRGDRTP